MECTCLQSVFAVQLKLLHSWRRVKSLSGLFLSAYQAGHCLDLWFRMGPLSIHRINLTVAIPMCLKTGYKNYISQTHLVYFIC